MKMTSSQKAMMNDYLITIRELVDPASHINLLLDSILLLDIHLKNEPDDNRVKTSKAINRLLLLIEKMASLQIVLSVANDDQDRYVMIMSDQLKSKGLEIPT